MEPTLTWQDSRLTTNQPQEGTGRCHCKVCAGKFQQYLEDKYETIEAFDERSGGIYWGQEYAKFFPDFHAGESH